MDPARTQQAAREFAASPIAVDAVYDADAEIFSPCALGGVLNDVTIPRLKAKLVCGGANNQLAQVHHDAALAARGIVFVPDYLANAGGVIDFYQETVDDRPAAVLDSVARIRPITISVLERADKTGQRPLAVADAVVRERLAAARTR
jgi:leucine dehydrogenase